MVKPTFLITALVSISLLGCQSAPVKDTLNNAAPDPLKAVSTSKVSITVPGEVEQLPPAPVAPTTETDDQ